MKPAIICHDAGGAEFISSYIRKNKIEGIYVLEGPAIKVFEKKIRNIKRQGLKRAIREGSHVICGTSWQSTLELEALIEGKAAGKKCIAFIDHWINYRDRFKLNEQIILPDEIWVGDIYARDLALKEFPKTPIVHIDNPYVEDLSKSLSNLRKKITKESKSILYVAEPKSVHATTRFGKKDAYGYDEWTALRYFHENMDLIALSVENITIRPHPAEDPNKYDEIIKVYGDKYRKGGKKSLIEEINDSDIVVGCESMAMVLGLIAKKRVICSIPPGGRPCQLPHSEIESLQKQLK